MGTCTQTPGKRAKAREQVSTLRQPRGALAATAGHVGRKSGQSQFQRTASSAHRQDGHPPSRYASGWRRQPFPSSRPPLYLGALRARPRGLQRTSMPSLRPGPVTRTVAGDPGAPPRFKTNVSGAPSVSATMTSPVSRTRHCRADLLQLLDYLWRRSLQLRWETAQKHVCDILRRNCPPQGAVYAYGCEGGRDRPACRLFAGQE